MAFYLGLDTSNYTTSAALYDSAAHIVLQEKQPLPVKTGELGLRQSDAVFHHTKQLPDVLEHLLERAGRPEIAAIGVSVRPRNIDGSYMPCFLCGQGAARQIAAVTGVPVQETSHQLGHILAALFAAEQLPLIGRRFIAFHVSGGTTEALLVTPDEEQLMNAQLIASSLDLKAGQAIDRVGVAMGLQFPCGPQLEALALEHGGKVQVRPSLIGMDCSLSGLENQCKALLQQGADKPLVAHTCIEYISQTLDGMTGRILEHYGEMPILYAGGVMSNSLLQRFLLRRSDTHFAPPVFSSDNAAGVAVFAALKSEGLSV